MIFTLILVILSAPLIWWYLFVLRKYKSLKNVPGPNPIPVIGNVLDIGTTPRDFFENLSHINKKHGDVFKLYVADELRVFVSKAELLEQIMGSNVHIKKSSGYDLFRLWLGEGVLISTGAKWKSRRRMITPTLHFKILEQFVDIFDSCGDILVRKLSNELGNDSVNIYPYINVCSLDLICQTSMGMRKSLQEGGNNEYVRTVRQYIDIVMRRFFSPWEKFDFLFRFSKSYEPHNRLLKFLHKFSDEAIQIRREEKSQDKSSTPLISEDGIRKKVALIDMLLESEKNKILSAEGVKEEIDTLMFEGHDTTSSGISFALLALADNPEIQDKVYEEITSVMGNEGHVTMQDLQNTKYLDMVVKEAQRRYPSVPFVERRLETDWSVGGYEFPKDTILNLFIWGAHQNERFFPEPEKFDPERFSLEEQAKRHNYAYIPFSAGPRNCVGQKFAMFAMKTIIIKVLKEFRLVPVPGYKPMLEMSAILKSTNGVCVRLEKR